MPGNMRAFMAEDNVCAQSLLRLVSHGNAVLAEILRLKNHVPEEYRCQIKEIQQKYQDVIMDFNYFKISDSQENKIFSNMKLQDLDDELKVNYLELITRFYLLFENIYNYVTDLNNYIEQLNEHMFIQQNLETILRDVEGKQLLCESLYLYGSMLLLCDVYIAGPVRERLLVAFYRYSTSQSQSNVDQVCKLLRDTGYYQLHGKRPVDYPVEYFGRININQDFIERVIGKLRSEDVYNQLAVYTIPEHRSVALATQASMLFICLFFAPTYLHSDQTKMREIVDKFFPSNWIITVYMGITIDVVDYWDNFKAAKTALANTCNNKVIKEIFSKRGASIAMLTDKTHRLLKEGTLTNDFVMDNINKILNLIINSNFVLRWLMLHNNNVTFFNNNKKSKQLRDLVLKESSYDSQKLLELLICTAEFELKVRECLNSLLNKRTEYWEEMKAEAHENINSLSELFSNTKPITKVQENEKLKVWFDNIATQISAIGDTITTKGIKKITQLIQALDEVEDFHGIKSTSTVTQFLNEGKDALKNALRVASLKEEYLVTLETVADVSYAWCTIDTYTKYMQDSIKENPSVTSRLRALFLKLASAMEIPLLRINQARSDDLISVSQYYSSELIKYIQKVLQIIPEMVFSIVEKIIELQTWTIKEIPTRLEKDKLREFSQLEHRMEVARLTHTASTFTTGILDMRSTLVGVIRVDPAELLEEGLLKELARHLEKKFEELLEPAAKKGQPLSSSLLARLQKLAESMEGYKRSLEYIQDYINMHGLKIWQKQISAIINDSVAREISVRKGVSFHATSAGFMGKLARQLVQLVEARNTSYLNINSAWYDTKTQAEVLNLRTLEKLNESIGIVGMHGLDTLLAFMIKNQLQTFEDCVRNNLDKLQFTHINFMNLDTISKDLEQLNVRNQKVFLSLTDMVVLLGTLQLLRKQIAYQLNTNCKFNSAHLEASLRTLNESLLNELKSSDKSALPSHLMSNLEEYLSRCGLHDPYQKRYLQQMPGLNNVEMEKLLAIVIVSQLPRITVCLTTGDLITRKAGDNIDGYPLLVGVHTVLQQSQNDVSDEFIDCLCYYIKAIGSRSNESVFITRVLEMQCEIFAYPYSKVNDKIPSSLLVHPIKL